MKATILVSIFLAGASAWPSSVFVQSFFEKRAVTPDNTCGAVGAGAGNNYTCDPTLANGGPCCSANGYCGNGTSYCGDGCQSDFGTCTGTVAESGGACGPDNDDATCPDSQCCSPAGYCGTTEDYCSDPYCQFGYGRCDSDATPAGARTDDVSRNLVGSVSYTDDIIDCVANDVIGLSYDDGPYEYTSQLLDLLDEFDFKATFFITGNNLGKGEIDTTAPYPSIIQRMISSGHQVASHTWSHYSLQNISHSMRVDQMVKNEMAFRNIIGKYPTYMRPPFSQCDEASGCWDDMNALGYHRVYFDLDTQDYLNPQPSQIQNSKNIVQQALAAAQANGYGDYLSIQHDIVEQSVTNLTSYYYNLIKQQGWKGVTVGTCLGDPEENWYRNPANGQAGEVLSTSSVSAQTSTQPTVVVTTKPKTTFVPTTKSSTGQSKPVSSSEPATSIKTSVPATPTKSTKSALAPSTVKSSTATPSATKSACIQQAGSFCGTLTSFSDAPTCADSSANCTIQSLSCVLEAGIFNLASCTKWSSTCTALAAYCVACATPGGACSLDNFLTKQ